MQAIAASAPRNALLLVSCGALLVSCGQGGGKRPRNEDLDAALSRGIRFLLSQQEPDGAWRSRTYAALKDGWALTATMAKALAFAPRDAAAESAFERALEHLASPVDEHGRIALGPAELPYPVYTAALAALAFTGADPSAPERFAREREAWIALLLEHQLSEDLGWSPADSGYGGWGYSATPPRRQDPARIFEADLSSTLFALGALRRSGRGVEDPALVRARIFVRRCQNLPAEEDPASELASIPLDGGFFMTPCNAFQNKAGGSAGESGRPRFHSYGSMTADGARALLRLGFSKEDFALVAASNWLKTHFEPGRNPGSFETVREIERESSFFYWAWSVSHAMNELDSSELGRRSWSSLAAELLERQRPDGSWANPATLVKEDDPLVATPLALGALAQVRLHRATHPLH